MKCTHPGCPPGAAYHCRHNTTLRDGDGNKVQGGSGEDSDRKSELSLHALAILIK